MRASSYQIRRWLATQPARDAARLNIRNGAAPFRSLGRTSADGIFGLDRG